jgi:hypothetical protein
MPAKAEASLVTLGVFGLICKLWLELGTDLDAALGIDFKKTARKACIKLHPCFLLSGDLWDVILSAPRYLVSLIYQYLIPYL